MEERKLNEKESLELITRMIQNTKDRMAENSGTPFLLWGYVTVIISLLVWFLLKETGNNNWQFLWFLLPVIAFPATLWSQRKARKMLKTYIDRVVDYVWTVFGLGAFLVYRHICMEDSYSVCHFADDGDGNCPDGTDCEHESGYDRGSAGSLALVGMFLYARHRPDTVFCIGVRLYDGDSRTLHEQCGEASQTIKEEDDICLKN